jgi:hypothetical protein
MQAMQVIASARSAAGRPSRLSVLGSLFLGMLCVTGSAAIAWAVFGLGLLERVVPTGSASAIELVGGAVGWTFALTAPAGLGLVGTARLVRAVERARARRPRTTPAVRLARAIGDDHVVATQVQIPDGGRRIPELVVGPFGAAVVEELPRPAAIMSHGIRTWEVRTGSGRVETIENPLDRATRDAERVRAWLSGGETEPAIAIYAAVVGIEAQAERDQACAVVAPDQIAAWLASLPPQAALDAARRGGIVRQIRAAL